MSEEVQDDVAPEESSAPIESSPEAPQPEASSPEPVEQQPVQQPVQEQPTVWSAFRSLPDFKGKEDREIAQSLYQSLEREKAAQKALAQYQRLIPYANEYLRHREPFEQYLASQNNPRPQPAAPKQDPGWWNPPELKDSYKRYLVRDEHGREAISQDAPPEARLAIEDYMEYRANFAQKFLANPEEALGPMVEQIAQQKANELLQQQLSERDQQTYVSTLERDNADWLYEADGKTPTREGLAIQRYIEEASQLGIGSPEARWEYATSMVERDLVVELRESDARVAAIQGALDTPAAAPQQPPAPAPMAQNQAEQDIEYLRREASRNPSRSTGAPDPRAPKAPMTFEERLKAQLAKDNLI